MENKKLSIGEEMMQWAEKYWLIDKICKGEIGKDGNSEAFSYDYFRRVFIKGIDGAIAERLSPTPQPESPIPSPDQDGMSPGTPPVSDQLLLEQEAMRLAPADSQENPAYPNFTDTDIWVAGFVEGVKHIKTKLTNDTL